jgi:hypothetical protein
MRIKELDEQLDETMTRRTEAAEAELDAALNRRSGRSAVMNA